jgi:hypothetical protein
VERLKLIERGVEPPSPFYRRATHILWLLNWVLFGGLAAFWWVPAYFREPHPIPWWFGGLALVARWAMVFNHWPSLGTERFFSHERRGFLKVEIALLAIVSVLFASGFALAA